MSGMTPREYCTQLFLMFPEYMSPALEMGVKSGYSPERAQRAEQGSTGNTIDGGGPRLAH
jgi:hypothetical protein